MRSKHRLLTAVAVRRTSGLHRLPGCILPALVALLVAMPGLADEYKLGIMDKLSIRVVEWQTAEGKFREWPGITGEYLVGPNGGVALPFAGELKVAGRTTADVAQEIAHNLQMRFGLSDLPEASVEILEFRPIFVAGEVHAPGKYPYDPEMTVLKAVSLAGGMRRGLDEGQRYERDFINAQGGYDVLIAEHDRLVAKRARLMSEEEGSDAIRVPEELKSNPKAAKLIQDETAIMETNRSSVGLRLKGLDELRTLYGNEIGSLEKKMDNQSHQLDLYRKELDRTAKLADQGLVTSARVLGLETTLSETQSNMLDIDAASLRAKQEMNKAALDSVDLQNEQKSKRAAEFLETQQQLDENALKTIMYKRLMNEALVNSPAASQLAGGDDSKLISYTVVRTVDGKVQEIPAGESTPLFPGDLVKVAIANGRS
ncbi:polysaccharide biosynthesis/export family protein [Rhizobium leucaenae]|uniref:Exopolysaccharide production protein ExoF n=1 Tax=Rhizobium leucaenae TaxID=29450 RepID=A0A7W7A0H1_9HYPH|nr:polysaccharide biosynthesis/export family protein [Rhizobium leucaenae]MBB4571510.1 exopolysaccharide production protein ExoF [Rhizobium leucaenae]MBB6304832.1 exopolysaccharide production protein ExoF [Rhizobium leucaenae]